MKTKDIIFIQETLDLIKSETRVTLTEEIENKFNNSMSILNLEAEKNSHKGRRKVERGE